MKQHKTFKDLPGGAVFGTTKKSDLKKLNSHSAYGADCPHCGLRHFNTVDFLGYTEHTCGDEQVFTQSPSGS